MTKVKNGEKRDRIRTVRLTASEDIELVYRTKRSGAKTPSALLRYAALHGREAEVPAWQHLRALTNAMVENTNELRRVGKLTKTLEAKVEAAYDRIIRS
jgi:hypothetical protein